MGPPSEEGAGERRCAPILARLIRYAFPASPPSFCSTKELEIFGNALLWPTRTRISLLLRHYCLRYEFVILIFALSLTRRRIPERMSKSLLMVA